ncbi:tripartite tricarboxylate transporter TctB family protein [Alphaproteobacteria bacterium LSUCC0396]
MTKQILAGGQVLPASHHLNVIQQHGRNMSLNRDGLVALCLILMSGGLMLASFEIREPDYGVLSPAAWPRLIIIIIGVLSVIYLLQSIGMPKEDKEAAPRKTIGEFILYWRNVIAVFTIFGLYLLVLPYLGMLVGNILFSFILLTVLGGWNSILIHLMLAFGASGGMWLLFTYALEVFLPRGSLTGL